VSGANWQGGCAHRV